ncbi:hypothetical protein RJ639_030930 [Escallonia herrerae]|uniref:RIN4 pathogenic type III effector avirulence factor Avr cleavage site domain-containing protein n=1 Tax=Escallonia herrerae TaxID=1293975 RepID=A0AA88XEF5_9ASTE|nr:hypothetical protein RJ639_030930 [Escallonia herrerae]
MHPQASLVFLHALSSSPDIQGSLRKSDHDQLFDGSIGRLYENVLCPQDSRLRHYLLSSEVCFLLTLLYISQQRSHVPKFGNWDNDNVPYTAYFENARKDKASGVRMNPNDPEENPGAFMFGRDVAGNDGVSQATRVRRQVSSEKSSSVEGYQVERHKQGHQRNTSDNQKSVSQISLTSESGSDKSNSDYSLMQKNHRRIRSGQQKSNVETNSFCPPSPGPNPNRLRGGSNTSDEIYSRSASVPMFGAWDERDPKSGEGFTIIFEKVKEEKQIAAAKFPVVPAQPSNYSKDQRKESQPKLDIFGCAEARVCSILD